MNFRKHTLFFLALLLVSGGCYKNESVPTADFTFSASNEFKVPCTVQFSSYCAGSFSYDWWFGCDSSVTTLNPPGSILQNPTFLYKKPGTFFVTLRAYTESRREWASVIKTIIVKDSVPK